MTRQELFNQFLESIGADPKDCEFLDDLEDPNFDHHGCIGFICPIDNDCKKCPYEHFWTKEIENGSV